MKWVKEELDSDLVRSMARRYDVDLLTASILVRRKITEPGQVLYYLEDDFRYLHSPFLFEAMEDAVDRIHLAIDEEEKILVFGDSDADGVTSTVLLHEAISSLGGQVSYRVPRGDEPYGLTAGAVDDFAASGGSLIVTVDCGISNHEEAIYARSKGIDLIVCDHHKLQAENPPEAVAVIDPKIEGCGYPFRDLAGAGVAYKLARALAFAKSGLYKQPVALLSISPDDGEPLRYRIEAVRLHNLTETGRFAEILEEGSPRSGIILEKLARFLEGRSIFVWGKAALERSVREIFGLGVDIECCDIHDGTAELFPAFFGKSLRDLGDPLRIARYSSRETRDIDILKTLFGMFAQKRLTAPSEDGQSLLQLAALGTIADLMPLSDENRIIVRRGIESIAAAPRKGLREILGAQGLGRGLNSTEIAWQVTPLLNAAGRIGKPEIALDLLLADDPPARMKAVEDIIQANGERKKMGADTWDAIYPAARESHEKNGGRFILIGSPLVKSGITGLLASRIVSTFKAPAIVAAFREDGTIVGSVRTANNFRISGLLAACADLFLDYGGHDAAAGFSMTGNNWDSFVRIAGDHLKHAEMASEEESISVDAELPHKYMRPDLQKLCARFEPFGEENPPLVFLARGVPMADAQVIGKTAKNHLKLTLDFGSYKWPALFWDGAECLERDFSFRAKDRLDILFKVTLKRWNGEERPQLELYDLRREEKA